MKPNRFYLMSPDVRTLRVRPVGKRTSGYQTRAEALRAWRTMKPGRSKFLVTLWLTDGEGRAINDTTETDLYGILF